MVSPILSGTVFQENVEDGGNHVPCRDTDIYLLIYQLHAFPCVVSTFAAADLMAKLPYFTGEGINRMSKSVKHDG